MKRVFGVFLALCLLLISVALSRAETPEEMFITDPVGYRVSYGKWQTQYGVVTATYEFFSDGTMTMMVSPAGYATGVTFPGIYDVNGKSMEMYAVGIGGTISYQKADISYDGVKLIINGDEYVPVD